MKNLVITGGVVILDEDDYEKYSGYSWHLVNGYARRVVYFGKDNNGKRVRKVILLHREVAKTPEGMFTDHINGDRLDNRKSNLRACTNRQNQLNSALSKRNTSGFKGVQWNKRKNRWAVKARIDGKQKYIGHFKSKLDAAKAYNDVVRQHHGEFARFNKV